MTSKEFQLLSSISLVRELRRGSSYADHGNKPHNLSILVSGEMEVCNYHRDVTTGGADREVVVNTIRPFEFVDSPQWISRNRVPDQVFLVTLRATEDCRYIMWPMEALETLFESHPQFKTYLECVVGCDVAEKLMHLDKQQQLQQSSGGGGDNNERMIPHVTSSGGENGRGRVSSKSDQSHPEDNDAGMGLISRQQAHHHRGGDDNKV